MFHGLMNNPVFKIKGKVAPSHAMNTDRGRRGIAPLML